MPFQIPQVPYDHETYHQATNRSLSAAKNAFDAHDAQNAIHTAIRDGFFKHGVEKTCSACLIHRHFDLGPGERNVEEGGRATTASRDLEGIFASSWLFYEGKLFPYELRRGKEGIAVPGEFVDGLGGILMRHGLCAVLGFQVYTEGVVGVESTDIVERVSTMVDYPEETPLKDEDMIKASFAFFR